MAGIFFLLLPPVLSVIGCPEDNALCIARFEEEPTATNLLKVQDPLLDQFLQLSETEREAYLTAVDFKTNVYGKYLARDFFSSETGAIQKYRVGFTRFLHASDISFAGFEDAHPFDGSYIKDGNVLSSADGAKVSLTDFKKNAPLGKKYVLLVSEGKLKIRPQKLPSGAQAYSFIGHLRDDSTGNLALDEGMLHRYYIKGGRNLKLPGAFKIDGQAQQLGGIIFKDHGSFSLKMTANEEKGDDLVFHDAHITSIQKQGLPGIGMNSLNVRGSVTINPADFPSIQQTLVVSKGQTFKVNGVTIDATKSDVNTYFHDPGISLVRKRAVYFDNEGIVVQGTEGSPSDVFSVTVPSASLREMMIAKQGKENIILPSGKKNWYADGDRSEEVRKLQQMLVREGLLEQGQAGGIFTDATTVAVKQWQEKMGIKEDGAFGEKALEAYYGLSSKGNLVLLPGKGRIVLVATDGKTSGLVADEGTGVYIGHQRYTIQDGNLLKQIKKSSEDAFGIPIEVLVEKKEKQKEEVQHASAVPADEPRESYTIIPPLPSSPRRDKKKLELTQAAYTGIFIDLQTQELSYFKNGVEVSRSHVGIGMGNNPEKPDPSVATIPGDYEITGIQKNKGSGKWARDLWYTGLDQDEGYYDSPRGRTFNVYGPGFIGLKEKTTGKITQIGIHGTNILGEGQLTYYQGLGKRVGQGAYVSHGCIRMKNDEWLELKTRVGKETPVIIF